MPLAAPAAPALVTGAVLRLFAVYAGAMSSFYLLLSVVPLYADAHRLGGSAAGLSTGAMMLTAVAAELASPRLARRVGFGRLLGAGVVLLGAPALLFPAVEGLTRVPPLGMAVLTGLSVVRGLGFALVVVAVGTIAAHAFPESRRGEGMGVLGVVAMVPAVTMLPLGVWLSQVASYPSVFAAAALCAFAVLPLTARLNAPATGDPSSRHPGSFGLRRPGIRRPLVVFTTTAVAGGVVVAFLPTAVSTGVAAAGLLAQAAVAAVTRWLAGRYADRYGGTGLLTAAVVACAVGMVLAAATATDLAVLTGMALFGAGFGLAQTVSLTSMLGHVSPDGYARVSAAWNAGYDIGWGFGAIGIGIVVAQLGHSAAFAVTGLLVLTVLPLTPRATQ